MKTQVKQYRLLFGLTQQQLADLVHVSVRTILSIEKEQYSPSLMLAYRLAQVFHVTVEELCCLKENKELEDQNNENLCKKKFGFRPFLVSFGLDVRLWQPFKRFCHKKTSFQAPFFFSSAPSPSMSACPAASLRKTAWRRWMSETG